MELGNVRSVLHLDDDPVMHMKAEMALSESQYGLSFNYRCSSVEADFWRFFEDQKPHLVLLDIDLGTTRDGICVLQDLRQRGFDGPVILFSSSADALFVVKALASGATDFVAKHIEDHELCLRVTQALLTQERVLASAPALSATGAVMREIEARVPRIVESGIKSILVQGETGTGKEVVADLFRLSVSKKVPFVAVNSGAISKDLIESELFGYEKGAFTGASAAKQGLLTAADGGWIFLDEVARLPLGAQAALLRTLENGEVRPVGGTQSRKVKVKVIAATNEDLDAMAAAGEFRADLLQRLRAYEIHLPPLRARSAQEREDILDALLRRLNEERKAIGVKYQVVPSVRRLFSAYNWKRGNVREMWQVLQAAAVDAGDGTITLHTLPKSFVAQVSEVGQSKASSAVISLSKVSYPLEYENLESELFAAVVDLYLKSGRPGVSNLQMFARDLGVTVPVATARLRELDALGRLAARGAVLVGATDDSL
jgi:DNA-binding NtrC family response regulator